MNLNPDKINLDSDQKYDYYLYIYAKPNTIDYSKIGMTSNPPARLRHYHGETLGYYYTLIIFPNITLKQMLKYEKRCLVVTYDYRDPTLCAIESRKMCWAEARAMCLNEIRAELEAGKCHVIEYNESDYPPERDEDDFSDFHEIKHAKKTMAHKMAKWEQRRASELKYKIPGPDREKILSRLYLHQIECLQAVEKEMQLAARAHFILLMGAGKTEILKAYITQNHHKYNQIYVIYNTDTLRDQNKFNYSIFKNYNIAIKMWSYQKLYNGNWGDIDKPDTLIIFDEFHHITNTITDGNKNKIDMPDVEIKYCDRNLLNFRGHVLACTATPKYVDTDDETTREKLYGRCVYNYDNCSYERLISGGYVVPTLYYISARDRVETQQNTESPPENDCDNVAAVTQCIIDSINKMAAGDEHYKYRSRKFIIFTKDTYECDAIYKTFMQLYETSDIATPRENVFISHSNLSPKDKIDIDKYKKLENAILFNCREFGEGFDNPSIDSVIMTYDTSSIEYFIQFFGRAIRANKDAPDKIARMCVVAWNCDVVKIIENIIKKIQSVGIYQESNTRFYYTAYLKNKDNNITKRNEFGSYDFINEKICLIRIQEADQDYQKLKELLKKYNIRNYTQFKNSELFNIYKESPAKKYAIYEFRWDDYPNIYTFDELEKILQKIKRYIDDNKIKTVSLPKRKLLYYKKIGVELKLIDESKFYGDLDIEDMYGHTFTKF